ncbi:MAG TPA: type VI secretion system baseplate subunit TssG [Sphingopyxis sp.]|nr:type VI secretion system baseplate subunit TssG [Sphingopyxis sp.]HMP45437.1 type VI secretion system baseplate subunit TssG [Sphingopyxis sp.]HMQ18308.1 type VI secretion system baseplate subunit TssG [Sphingopyxis sp.]
MAAEDRAQARHLGFLQRLAERPRRFGMFAALRGIEARAQDKPPLGLSKLPEQDAAELRQVPHLHFPGPTLAGLEFRKGRPVVAGYWLGLTGPMSPLPTHLTEFALYEERYAKKRTFGRFLDMLAGRMLQLFYRAWAVSQPAVQADRPENDRFAFYVDALSGAGEGAGPDSAFPRAARLHYAALFASRRSAGSIEHGLSHLLGMPVEVREFQPRWRDIARDDQSRLGTCFHALGDAVVGQRILMASDAFSVRVTAGDVRAFRQLLPTGPLFPIVAEALDALAPGHLEWDITLCLPRREAPAARLDGQSLLGWSSWVGTAANDGISRDVHLRRSALRQRKRIGTS